MLHNLQVWVDVFAVAGLVSFTWLVTKHGLVPVAQKLASWFTTAKADVSAFEARLVALENAFRAHNTPAAPTPPPSAPG